MAVVLAGTGLFLYLRLEAELDRTVEAGLRSRADDVAAFVRQSDPASTGAAPRRLAEVEESIAQVIDAGGRIVDQTTAGPLPLLLTPPELVRARRRTTMVDRRRFVAFEGDPVRLL